MNINPNLKNPLAFFALCLVVIESVFVALLMHRVENIVLCPCLVKALFIFIIAFPLIVFIGFYILLIKRPELLFSPYENALAKCITNMSKNEKQDYHLTKDVQYGESNKATKEKPAISMLSEDKILSKYIAKYASFMQKNIKIATENGARYFDGYANWNGCHFVVEVKQLQQWAPVSIQGVRAFVANARNSFSNPHMTLILSIADQYSKETIVKTIREVDDTIHVVFATIKSSEIEFSFMC